MNKINTMHIDLPERTCYTPDHQGTVTLSTDSQKNTHISNFTKIHPAGAQLFHAE